MVSSTILFAHLLSRIMPDTEEQKAEKKKGREEKAKSQQLRRQRRRITKIEEETKHREARIAKLDGINTG